MTDKDSAKSYDKLTLPEFVRTAAIKQVVAVGIAVVGLMVMAYRYGRSSADTRRELEATGAAVSRASLEAEVKSREMQLRELADAKAAVTHLQQSLVNENESLRRDLALANQRLARLTECEPIRSELAGGIRQQEVLKSQVLSLEVMPAEKNFQDALAVTRKQVHAVAADVARLKDDLSKCMQVAPQSMVTPASAPALRSLTR